jgi:hypothetical protein
MSTESTEQLEAVPILGQNITTQSVWKWERFKEIFLSHVAYYGEERVGLRAGRAILPKNGNHVSLKRDVIENDISLEEALEKMAPVFLPDEVAREDLLNKYYIKTDAMYLFIDIHYPKETVVSYLNGEPTKLTHDVFDTFLLCRFKLGFFKKDNSTFYLSIRGEDTDLTRTTLEFVEYEKGYIHSHASRCEKCDHSPECNMCFGESALKEWSNNLTRMIEEDVDEDEIFFHLGEFDRWMRTENLSMGPYIKISETYAPEEQKKQPLLYPLVAEIAAFVLSNPDLFKIVLQELEIPQQFGSSVRVVSDLTSFMVIPRVPTDEIIKAIKCRHGNIAYKCVDGQLILLGNGQARAEVNNRLVMPSAANGIVFDEQSFPFRIFYHDESKDGEDTFLSISDEYLMETLKAMGVALTLRTIEIKQKHETKVRYSRIRPASDSNTVVENFAFKTAGRDCRVIH